MNTIKIKKGSTKMVAHRGLSGLETENSIPAFIAAGNRSYFGIETDVHVTADGKFVIVHDNFTGRVAEDNIEVEKSDYENLRRVLLKNICPAAGAEGYDEVKEYYGIRNRPDLVIPNLKEYVSICKKYEKECVLELKNEFVPEDISRMLEEIKSLDYLENMVFISFSLNNLICLRNLLPDQELYYLTGGYNEDILHKLKKYRLNLDVYYPALTKDIIDRLHNEKILINCWTCDSKEEGEKLAEWGVDYITSNILE